MIKIFSNIKLVINLKNFLSISKQELRAYFYTAAGLLFINTPFIKKNLFSQTKQIFIYRFTDI